MNKLIFVEDKDTGVQAVSRNREPAFSLCGDTAFPNRQFCFEEDSFLFDGYSIWFESQSEALRYPESFTVSVCFVPLGVSDGGDGLYSFYEENRGFLITLEKDCRVRAEFGDGRHSIEFYSVKEHVRLNARNIITVIYRQDAGWCDLYVNGVFSNRKQFRRRCGVAWPVREKTAYLGKLVDGKYHQAKAPDGCFYGWMQWISLERGALEEDEVKALHALYFDPKEQETLVKAGMPDRNAYRGDCNRPVYHLIAPGKWMNEPHAPMYYNGLYHIFYQANPHAPIWNHIEWGHQVSEDMVHWQDCPLALRTDADGYDAAGCWSGSSVIDREGKPRIYYTAGDDRRFPNQGVALAVPEDGEDKRLERWTKWPSLVKEQDTGWLGEFRDPFVWVEQDTYFMLVGTGDENNGGGNAALYSSADGISWEAHGFIADYSYEENRELGHVWELPVLLPVYDENGVLYHILMFCACQIEGDNVENYYFLGHWDAGSRRFEKLHEKAMLFDLGWGVFTGPSGFVTPDKRSVVFTIAQGKRHPKDEFHAGWAHNGGLPVELSVKDGQLQLAPIREFESLRTGKLLERYDISEAEANECLNGVCGDSFLLEIEVCSPDAAVKVFGDGDQCRTIYYDRTKKRLGAQDESGREIGKWRGHEDDVAIGEEPVQFSCYLDHSILEIYLNKRKSVSLRMYTETAGRKFQAAGGRIGKLVLWEMESAYSPRDHLNEESL